MKDKKIRPNNGYSQPVTIKMTRDLKAKFMQVNKQRKALGLPTLADEIRNLIRKATINE